MTEQTPRVICVGEAVIELRRGPDGAFSAACAGDSFNTAVYLARAGLNVGFATAVGDDPYSDSIVALALAEGLGARLIYFSGITLSLYSNDGLGRLFAARNKAMRDAHPVGKLKQFARWRAVAPNAADGFAGLAMLDQGQRREAARYAQNEISRALPPRPMRQCCLSRDRLRPQWQNRR